MDLFNMILQKGISIEASDIHLSPGSVPVYRVDRLLIFDESKLPLSVEILENLVQDFSERIPDLEKKFKEKKKVDFSYSFGTYVFRINLSLTKGSPTFSIRLIPNREIDIDKFGTRELINRMKRVSSGLILITGKINSGKSTTLNSYLQEINKEESKKIVTIEDPIEFVHNSDKCIVVQKEVGTEADINSYYDGVINLLREDTDIAVLGEIRDRKTMDVAIQLAESGGLVLGTLHTRSCGETVERVINMYELNEQRSIKNTMSSILKLVVSQKLVPALDGRGLVLVPEIMVVNSTIAAQIRQEKFNVSELEDSIHSLRLSGCKSYEVSLTELYLAKKIDMKTIKAEVEEDRLELIKGLIVNGGGSIT